MVNSDFERRFLADRTKPDEYDVTISREGLIRFITGIEGEIDDRLLWERLAEDCKIVRAKYNLPPYEMLTSDPREYERRLREIARQAEVEILPRTCCRESFEKIPTRGVFIDDTIFVEINDWNFESYIESLIFLEHEVIHALQEKRYPRMPIELKEYEAYVANANLKHLQEHPEDIQEVFFALIQRSVEIDYQLENEMARRRNEPPIKPPY